MLSIIGCGRSSFEGLLQQRSIGSPTDFGCGRSGFEGLLQLYGFLHQFPYVVEGPVLRDYYNTSSFQIKGY